MQEDKPPRRVADVLDSRDGLLAAVAALVQVDGGFDHADLVRQGAVVGVQPWPRDPGRDPRRLEGPHARDREGRRQLSRRVGRDDQIGTERTAHDRLNHAVLEEAGGRGEITVRSANWSALSREGARQGLHHQHPGQVLDFHPEHEAH